MIDVMLNNGMLIPIIGLGTYSLNREHILNGINCGYRLIDTAAQYGNEEEVGAAIKCSSISRQEIFISTKLWMDDINNRRAKEACFESLRKLGTDYIDMYLIHWPTDGVEYAWLEMEELLKAGYVRSIGVCNFHEKHFEKLAHIQNINPVVDQIEVHPRFHNDGLIDYCIKQNIQVVAWSPFGGTGARMLQNTVLLRIADKHKKTSSQIVLRWHIQRGIIAIPRTTNFERLKLNMNVFDFQLDDEDMAMITSIDTGRCLGADPEKFNF